MSDSSGARNAPPIPQDTEDKIAAENHMVVKAREILADYDAGRPLQVSGDGWLVRFAAAYIGKVAEVRLLCDHDYEAQDDKGWQCKLCGHQT